MDACWGGCPCMHDWAPEYNHRPHQRSLRESGGLAAAPPPTTNHKFHFSMTERTSRGPEDREDIPWIRRPYRRRAARASAARGTQLRYFPTTSIVNESGTITPRPPPFLALGSPGWAGGAGVVSAVMR